MFWKHEDCLKSLYGRSSILNTLKYPSMVDFIESASEDDESTSEDDESASEANGSV